MPSTHENLKNAFAGESQAYMKYVTFAKKAEKDGFANIAKLFRTTAEAEKIHAEGHLGSDDAIGSTAENLETAISGETYEHNEMYPPMYEQAVAEGHKAKRMFGFAVEAEKVHAALYRSALEAVKKVRTLQPRLYGFALFVATLNWARLLNSALSAKSRQRSIFRLPEDNSLQFLQ